MRPFKIPASKINPVAALIIGSALAWLSLSTSAWAAEPLYTTTANQTASPGTSWASSIIWKLNGAGTAVAATAGNTYEALYNGTVKLGNGTATTLLRNPYSAGTPNIAVFPGDCLILDTNTQLRFKALGTSGTTAQGGVPIAYPTNAFNGANGLPGLVLNGGCLNTGDSDAFVILGTIQAAPGTLSYLNPANSFSGDTAKRDFIIAAQLSGSGSLALLNATNTVPQSISGTSNTFSGTWIVKEGWLQGTGDGTADGYNSLGTNTACTFLIDPQWTPPPIFDAGAVFTAGPALLDMGAATANCGGTLILTNGGQLNLHGIVVFGAVTIQGTPLAAGTHFYSELITNFASSFSAGGSGAIIVRPYNPVPPALGPTIVTQPLPEMVYAGVTAQFTVSATVNGAPPLTYQWQRAGTNLVDGGNITGSTNATLFVSNVSAADAVNYTVIVRNAGGPVTSVSVPLTLVTSSGETYEQAVVAAHPVAFYQLNETGNPATNNSPAFDYAGGFVGTYGNTVQNGNSLYGIAGPQAGNGFPGFAAGNKAAQFANGSVGANISVVPWGMNTNTVTVAAWVKPSGVQVGSSTIVSVRNGTGFAPFGLEYTGATDISGNHPLGYNWDDESMTYNWISGLTPPPDQWSFVALVVTPTNATIYVINTNGALSSTHVYNHRVLAFTAGTLIGADSLDGGTGSRSFNGVIDDVSVFGSALSQSQIMGLYSAASGGATLAPALGVQPLSATLYQGQTAQFTGQAAGTLPLAYQWQAGATGSGVYTNLTDGGRFSGSAGPTLSIVGIDMPNTADYLVVVTNLYGTLTSSVANLTVLATNAAQNITMSVQEAGGSDWNTAGVWSDSLGGVAASVSAAAFPGSTYELLPGSRLRTPVAPPNNIFPGIVLTNDGTGVFTNNPAAGAPNAEIRLKQTNPGAITNPAVVVFPRLVMNGGQVDLGSDGLAVIQGEIDIITNAIFYVDSGGGANRWFQIDAFLTGSASIEYRAFDTSFTGDLNITCSSNTYSGTWNVVQGALLGTAANCLGTNTITVATNGALETTYDIQNPHGNLILYGKMFLHQNDTFGAVAINGTALNPGVYPFATLAATYSNNFPVTWKPQTGAAGFTNGSGSLTVLGLVPPTITVQPVASQTLYAGQKAQFSATVMGGQPLAYQWQAGAVGSGVYTNLHNGGAFAGATTTNLIISPLDVGNTADYILVATNMAGKATSTVATLTVLPTFPAITPITLSAQEAIGQDWDTVGMWNDGQGGLPASVSAVEFPGSTYEVLPGARLRSTDSATNTTFPGSLLTIDGNGVYVNNPAATDLVGEFRFKQIVGGTGIVNVPRLVMNGGQLDLGNDGTVIVQGEIDIEANTPFNSNATADRGYVIAAWLTGHGSIEYHAYQSGFQAAYVNNLNIAGTSNTYSGTWNVVAGTLLGTGPNALGTNSITVRLDGALETTYDLNCPNAILTVNGRVYLHQHDTFKSVFIGSTALAPGTYTFAQLNAAYPNNFPATWTAQSGSTTSAGSGSLTVVSGALSLSAAAPVASIGQDIAVTVSIPPGANSSSPVTVTVANDNSTAVSLPGGNPSLLSVVFGTGAGTVQSFTAHALAVGTAHLTASAPGQTASLPLSLWVRHTPALIGHWTFSNAGNPYAESSGFSPATTHDGTPIGAVALSSDVPSVLSGNSLDLTGGGVLEILNTRTNEAGYLNTFDDEIVAGFTVSAWVKLNSNWTATAWVAFASKRGDDNAGFQLRRDSAGPNACFTIRGTPGADDPKGAINYEDGNWHLMTGVWDGGAGTRLLYVDGVLDTAASLTNDFAPMALALTNSLVIGGEDRSNDGSGSTTITSPLMGYLADVRLYNYALSPTQVQTLFNPAYVPPVTLGLQYTNGSLTLSWPTGTLLQATNVTGPWSTNNASSPLTVTPTGLRMFYRVEVQ